LQVDFFHSLHQASDQIDSIGERVLRSVGAVGVETRKHCMVGIPITDEVPFFVQLLVGGQADGLKFWYRPVVLLPPGSCGSRLCRSRLSSHAGKLRYRHGRAQVFAGRPRFRRIVAEHEDFLVSMFFYQVLGEGDVILDVVFIS
jgi:hypothetical protein